MAASSLRRGQIHLNLKEVPMHKNASLLFGVTLIALALLALAGNLLVGASGLDALRLGFHTWPLAVIGAGLLFCVPPFIFRQQKGLGGLFIPGLPVLTTGLLLFAASLTGNWGLWGTLWPLEVIGVALGFVLAAIFLRVVWLMVPASIVGLTGLVLLFCSLTGMWAAWAVLWTVVPFSVGLPLLLIGVFQKNEGVKLGGLIVTGFAGLAFAAMSAFTVTPSWVTGILGPAVILALGLFMVVSALWKRKTE
jgi:hypothetical protein